MLLIISLILAVLGLISLLVLAWWGLPILAIAALLAVVHVMSSRKAAGPDAGTIERGRRAEPTGTPRKASGDAESANQRVGQG